MYTLKIAWQRFDDNGIEADESTLFIAADRVTVHGRVMTIEGHDSMCHWADDDFFEYRINEDSTDNPKLRDGRLIEVRKDGILTWYTASRAWLLGPTGQTIERIAP